MGNWKRLNLLISVLLFLMFGTSASGTTETGENAIQISMRVFERASRVELASQKLKIDLNGKPATFPLSAGKSLKGAKVIITGRSVKINSEPGYQWIEVTLKNADGKSISYGTSTFSGRKFSFGTGFQDPSDPRQEMILMLDSTSTELK